MIYPLIEVFTKEKTKEHVEKHGILKVADLTKIKKWLPAQHGFDIKTVMSLHPELGFNKDKFIRQITMKVAVAFSDIDHVPDPEVEGVLMIDRDRQNIPYGILVPYVPQYTPMQTNEEKYESFFEKVFPNIFGEI